jgi:hypothetical protein
MVVARLRHYKIKIARKNEKKSKGVERDSGWDGGQRERKSERGGRRGSKNDEAAKGEKGSEGERKKV